MQDKQKVTLYLSPELHRQLKIRAAVDAEPMSTLVERAVVFYLTNPEVVERVEAAHGHTHQVYVCPECTSSVVLKNGEMVALSDRSGVLAESEKEIPIEKVRQDSGTDQHGEEELVPC